MPRKPYDQRNDESGKFTPTYSATDFLDAIPQADPATTSNVGEIVGCKYRTAYQWLNDLADEGLVESQKIGNSLIWSVND